MSRTDGDQTGGLDRDALVDELNVLLEAERAGARVGARLEAEAQDAELKALARVIRADEAHWCGMLTDLLTGLGATPSEVVGAFYDKAMAIEGIEARIAFVNRGQAWVVKKLEAMLPRVGDARLHASLAEMLVAHERNIESAATLFEKRSAAG